MDSTENAIAGYIRQIGKIQTIAQTHIRCGGVTKVLSACASCYVRVSETLTGEVRLAGRETVDIVASSGDGLSRESGWTEFTDRAELDGITTSSSVTAVGRVLDTDVVSVENDSVTLASVIEITLYAEERSVIPEPLPQSDGVFTGDSRMTFSRLVAKVTGKAEVRSENKVELARYVCADARTCISGAEAGLDSVTVNGDVCIDGMGLTADGASQPFALVLPFSEELAAEGARRGDLVQMRAVCATVAAEESEEGITFIVTVDLSGAVYSELAASCAVDAFSPDCELTLTRTPVRGVAVTGEHCVSGQAEGAVTLPEGENADRVLALCCFAAQPLSAYCEYGRAVIEGAVTGTIIYADAEAGRKSSCAAEIPFKVVTDVEADDDTLFDVTGAVGKISVRPSRLGELNVRCELHFCLQTAKEVKAEAVTAAVCGEPYPDRKGMISVYVASGGETLWDSARELRVTPETVLMQNDELDFPLSRGDKVFVFRTK